MFKANHSVKLGKSPAHSVHIEAVVKLFGNHACRHILSLDKREVGARRILQFVYPERKGRNDLYLEKIIYESCITELVIPQSVFPLHAVQNLCTSFFRHFISVLTAEQVCNLHEFIDSVIIEMETVLLRNPGFQSGVLLQKPLHRFRISGYKKHPVLLLRICQSRKQGLYHIHSRIPRVVRLI